MQNVIALFEDEGVRLEVPISPEQETVWLCREQMASLFGRDIKTIGKHIANARREELQDLEVVAKFATTSRHGALPDKTQTHMTEYYNLDVILSVGYRVKSKRGIAFRKWASTVLKQYVIEGYAVNNDRLRQLGSLLRLMSGDYSILAAAKKAECWTTGLRQISRTSIFLFIKMRMVRNFFVFLLMPATKANQKTAHR